MVSQEAIDDNLGPYIYREVVPLDIRYDWNGAFHVIAICDQFDDVERHGELPLYDYDFIREYVGRESWGNQVIKGVKFTRRQT